MTNLSICPICGGKVGYLLEDTKLNTDFKIKSEGLSTWTERVYMKNMFDKDISIANGSYDCYESLLIKYNKHKPITTGITKKKTIDEIEHITGHDFFYNVPINEQNVMESTFHIGDW